MTKVIEFITPEGDLQYSVLAPNGIKPFGSCKNNAIQLASMSATRQMGYAGWSNLDWYKNHMGYRVKSTFLVNRK